MRTNWNFDGKGINGGDEYMSRIATLTEHGHVLTAGKLLAAAPDLLAALEKMLREHDILSGVIDGNEIRSDRWPGTAKMARSAIAKAKG